MKMFEELGLQETVLQAISKMGFETTTPIQEQTIPQALTGVDVIGQSQTGTGKTAAFGIPLVQECEPQAHGVQGIVVAPTRELAVQVAEELNKIGQFKGIRALPIYGGQDIVRQIKALRKGPHIIVGTPGRLLDHIRRRTLVLGAVKTVVLDEADEMLTMGFIEDIEAILEETPEGRQTLLFSATMPLPIQSLAKRYMDQPQLIQIRAKEITVPNIQQNYIEVQERQKFEVLCRLLDVQAPDLAIVFGRTKRRVDELAEGLSKRGYSVEGIHGDLTQARREHVLRQFREGTIDILVATDVAARGLDITGVTHVYNFDIPQDPESYVHRIGRTGRLGRAGEAITFVLPREMGQLRLIQQTTKRKIARRPIPTLDEALEGQQRLAMEKLLALINEGGYEKYRSLAEGLLDEYDSIVLVAASLKLLTNEPNLTPVRLTEEKPVGGFRDKGRPRTRGPEQKKRTGHSQRSRHYNRGARG